MTIHSRGKSFRAVLTFVGVFFMLGLVLGSCSLGMKIPVTLWEMATGTTPL
jgi:hypothetical protein